jgi:hypothetical protein
LRGHVIEGKFLLGNWKDTTNYDKMSGTKRKAIGVGLHRRVRARREESEEIEDIPSSPEASDQGSDGEGNSVSSDDEENEASTFLPNMSIF